MRKRRDGQVARMRQKLGRKQRKSEIEFLNDVLTMMLTETYALLNQSNLQAFKRDTVKALKKLHEEGFL